MSGFEIHQTRINVETKETGTEIVLPNTTPGVEIDTNSSLYPSYRGLILQHNLKPQIEYKHIPESNFPATRTIHVDVNNNHHIYSAVMAPVVDWNGNTLLPPLQDGFSIIKSTVDGKFICSADYKWSGGTSPTQDLVTHIKYHSGYIFISGSFTASLVDPTGNTVTANPSPSIRTHYIAKLTVNLEQVWFLTRDGDFLDSPLKFAYSGKYLLVGGAIQGNITNTNWNGDPLGGSTPLSGGIPDTGSQGLVSLINTESNQEILTKRVQLGDGSTDFELDIDYRFSDYIILVSWLSPANEEWYDFEGIRQLDTSTRVQVIAMRTTGTTIWKNDLEVVVENNYPLRLKIKCTESGVVLCGQTKRLSGGYLVDFENNQVDNTDQPDRNNAWQWVSNLFTLTGNQTWFQFRYSNIDTTSTFKFTDRRVVCQTNIIVSDYCEDWSGSVLQTRDPINFVADLNTSISSLDIYTGSQQWFTTGGGKTFIELGDGFKIVGDTVYVAWASADFFQLDNENAVLTFGGDVVTLRQPFNELIALSALNILDGSVLWESYSQDNAGIRIDDIIAWPQETENVIYLIGVTNTIDTTNFSGFNENPYTITTGPVNTISILFRDSIGVAGIIDRDRGVVYEPGSIFNIDNWIASTPEFLPENEDFYPKLNGYAPGTTRPRGSLVLYWDNIRGTITQVPTRYVLSFREDITGLNFFIPTILP